MNDRLRKLLPLGAGLVLGLVLLSRWLGSSGEAPPARPPPAAPARSDGPAPSSGEAPPGPSATVTPGRGAPGPAPHPAPASRPGETSEASEEATPSLEVAHPLPQQNDPIEPELPQTAEWKHGKLVRITEVLTRDVERLETELQAARGRGDTDEARRLEVQIARHRARLGTLREETAAMARAAQEEARRP